MPCPDPNDLAAFAEGLNVPEPVARHLASCADCSTRVAAVREDLALEAPRVSPPAAWMAVAQGALGKGDPASFRRPLMAAAALLLLAGGALAIWPDRVAATPPLPAAPEAASAPAWLLDPGTSRTAGTDREGFLLGGIVEGLAANGSRWRAGVGPEPALAWGRAEGPGARGPFPPHRPSRRRRRSGVRRGGVGV